MTITFTAPALQNRTPTQGQAVTFTVTATAPRGIARVVFTRNGTPIGAAVTSAPYSVVWDTTAMPAGAYTIVATGYDNSSPARSATATILVTLGASPVTVAFTAPTLANRSVYQSVPVALAVTAASTGANITKVEFSADAGLLGTDLTAPYQWNWPTTGVALGTHAITAKATDDSVPTPRVGYATITITVLAASVAPPTVAITAPTEGQTVTGNMQVLVTAQALATGATISSIVVNLGAINKTIPGGTQTVNGATTLDTTQVSDGDYSLTATATDSLGHSNADTIGIKVHNTVTPPPPPF